MEFPYTESFSRKVGIGLQSQKSLVIQIPQNKFDFDRHHYNWGLLLTRYVRMSVDDVMKKDVFSGVVRHVELLEQFSDDSRCGVLTRTPHCVFTSVG